MRKDKGYRGLVMDGERISGKATGLGVYNGLGLGWNNGRRSSNGSGLNEKRS
jgi:hypothetical protein